MDEREKAQLKKQQKIVDCIEHLNTALSSFERLEEYKSRVIPIIDGLDLTHSDTYFEVTKKLKREIFYIKSFTACAANDLVGYRRLIHPERQIYSVKEKKNQAKYGIEPIGDWKKFSEQTRRILDDSQKILDDNQKKTEELLQKQKQTEVEEREFDKELKETLALVSKKKRESKIRRSNRITEIRLDILRLKWAMFLLFVLQTAILIKLCF